MKYKSEIRNLTNDPQALEDRYQAAIKENKADEFQADMLGLYEEMPDNILLAAWHYRLQHVPKGAPPEAERARNWKLAIPLSLLTGLIFWALSDVEWLVHDHIPYLVLIWAPLATILALVFLSLTPKQHYRRAALVGIGLASACVYILLANYAQKQGLSRFYLDLMTIHLPLLSWIAIGVVLMGFGSGAGTRFAFLIKSIEVIITAGLYLIAGVVFGMITLGMFEALNVTFPEIILRLIMAGGFGLLPILAVASVYDPFARPEAQDFSQGLSKFIFTMMRLLLPLTLVILVIYLFVIPFNFMEPFNNRDVLIVYNVMLFAIMGLLIGVTPLREDELSPRIQIALRSGIMAVAILATLVSLYALSAVVYRTVLGGITINRTAIIGWNSINISILILLVYRQLRYGREGWVERLHSTFCVGTNAYSVWAIFLALVIPLVFR